tara:strand:+ start:13137 stop:13946 length:810 start_codon:yes stop_codon:yes gene_type:complete
VGAAKSILRSEVASLPERAKIFVVKLLARNLGCVVALVSLASCSATGFSIAELAPEVNATRYTQAARVSVGDVIMVTFPFMGAWNHQARVRPDGQATFRLVGDAQVVGLSLPELASRLREMYEAKGRGQDVENLTVDMPGAGGASGSLAGGQVGDPSGQVVYVLGDVNGPGPQSLSGRILTLTEAIGAAGGHLKATANLRNTILVRRLEGSNEMRSWRLDADIYNWGKQPPIFLQARDIVFVPNTAIDDLDIWVDQYLRRMLPFPFFFQ